MVRVLEFLDKISFLKIVLFQSEMWLDFKSQNVIFTSTM